MKKARSRAASWLIMISLIIGSASGITGCGVYVTHSYRNIKVDYVEMDDDATTKPIIHRGDEDIDFVEGIHLLRQDLCETNDSYVDLIADEDKYISAAYNTVFNIEASGNTKNGKIKVNLQSGYMDFYIEEKLSKNDSFEVYTPNATMSVRGTSFGVTYDSENNTTEVSVNSGIVWVESEGGESVLEEGDKAVITDNEIEVTKALPKVDGLPYYDFGFDLADINFMGKSVKDLSFAYCDTRNEEILNKLIQGKDAELNYEYSYDDRENGYIKEKECIIGNLRVRYVSRDYASVDNGFIGSIRWDFSQRTDDEYNKGSVSFSMVFAKDTYDVEINVYGSDLEHSIFYEDDWWENYFNEDDCLWSFPEIQRAFNYINIKDLFNIDELFDYASSHGGRIKLNWVDLPLQMSYEDSIVRIFEPENKRFYLFMKDKSLIDVPDASIGYEISVRCPYVESVNIEASQTELEGFIQKIDALRSKRDNVVDLLEQLVKVKQKKNKRITVDAEDIQKLLNAMEQPIWGGYEYNLWTESFNEYPFYDVRNIIEATERITEGNKLYKPVIEEYSAKADEYIEILDDLDRQINDLILSRKAEIEEQKKKEQEDGGAWKKAYKKIVNDPAKFLNNNNAPYFESSKVYAYDYALVNLIGDKIPELVIFTFNSQGNGRYCPYYVISYKRKKNKAYCDGTETVGISDTSLYYNNKETSFTYIDSDNIKSAIQKYKK